MAPPIKRIEFQNFRRHERFSVSCREQNVFVGANNSGKSSALDALRILADVVRFGSRLNPTLKDQPGYGVRASYEIPHTSIGITLNNVTTNYNEDWAVVTVTHENGNQLIVRAHHDRAIQAFLVSDRDLPRTATAFRKAFPAKFIVIPTLGPVEEDEPFLADDTVKKNGSGRNSSRHFRNIWHRKTKEEFEQLKKLVEQAWDNITISSPELQFGDRQMLRMFYREGRIDREIYWSGYGFQIWLQIMSHVLRGDDNSIIVMDEPDIYLHSDLQKRLYRIISDRFLQSFIATHSTEIVNEAQPGDILLVRRDSRSAQRVTTDDNYRQVYSYLGASDNAEFARLARARKIVFFEGNDRKIIRKFATKLRLFGPLTDPDTLFLQAGGFEQWRRVREVNWTLQKLFGIEAKIAALFDRDYRCHEAVIDFEKSMNNEQLTCRVLGRKEIENYALVESVLTRVALQKTQERKGIADETNIRRLIENCTEQLRIDAQTQYQAKLLSYFRQLGDSRDDSTLLKEAVGRFEKNWEHLNQRLAIIPGKQFISLFSSTLSRDFGFSVSLYQLIDEMKVEEIDTDLIESLGQVSTFFAD